MFVSIKVIICWKKKSGISHEGDNDDHDDEEEDNQSTIYVTKEFKHHPSLSSFGWDGAWLWDL